MRWISTLFAVALPLTLPADAGGLFGDGGVARGDVGKIIERKSATPLARPTYPVKRGITFGEAIDQSATDSAPGGELEHYDALVGRKSVEQKTLEAATGAALDLEVGSICLTAVGACEVELTTIGSSCFCLSGRQIEIGVVK